MILRMTRGTPILAAAAACLLTAGCTDEPPTAPLRAGSMTVSPSSLGASELRIYVPNSESETVSVIRASDNTVIATIPVGQRPLVVALTPDGRSGYVSHSSTDGISLAVFRTSDNAVTATFPRLPARSWAGGLEVTPDGQHLYIANTFYSEAQPVSRLQVLRTSDNELVASVGIGPHLDVAITPDGAFALLTSTVGERVNVVRTSDNAHVHTISLGTGANRIVITPDGDRAFVSLPTAERVAVIRLSDYAILETIEIPSAVGLGMSPDGAHLYVTNRYLGGVPGTVTVIRTADLGVHTVFPVGFEPQSVAFSPDGEYAYVANNASHTVSVVRTSDFSVAATVPVGSNPLFIAAALVPLLTPQEEIAALRDAVDALQSAGTLGSGRANSLRQHLENALRMLERGQLNAAAAQISVFISQLEDLVRDGVLSEAEAAPLLEAAQRVLDAIAA